MEFRIWRNPIETVVSLIVAVPEAAGSALYGMIDILVSAGNLWQQLAGIAAVRIAPCVSNAVTAFRLRLI